MGGWGAITEGADVGIVVVEGAGVGAAVGVGGAGAGVAAVAASVPFWEGSAGLDETAGVSTADAAGFAAVAGGFATVAADAAAVPASPERPAAASYSAPISTLSPSRSLTSRPAPLRRLSTSVRVSPSSADALQQRIGGRAHRRHPLLRGGDGLLARAAGVLGGLLACPRGVRRGLALDRLGAGLGGLEDPLHLRSGGRGERVAPSAAGLAAKILDLGGQGAQMQIDAAGVIAPAHDRKVAALDRLTVHLHAAHLRRCGGGRARGARSANGRARIARQPGARLFGGVLAGARAGDRLDFLHVAQLSPQLADLVAQLRRVLEAEVVGGGDHLLLELDDHPLQLVLWHFLGLRTGGAALAPPLRHLRLRLQELGDIGDPLDDRGSGDPVLLVVGELDLAPPVGLRDGRAASPSSPCRRTSARRR